MAAPLLQTKFFIPPLHAHTVHRRELLLRLAAARESNACLFYFSAPAGCGKTNLVSEWVRELKQQNPAYRIGWVSLDPADDDYEQFFSYLVASLYAADDDLGQKAAALLKHPLSLVQKTDFLATWINELGSAGGQILLVLDDFHHILDKTVLNGVAYLIDHLPQNVMVAILTRADAPFPLARWQASGRMLALRGDDLRFSPIETGDYIRLALGVDLPAADTALIQEKIEGWPAGLSLAALTVRRGDDIHGHIASLSETNRYILDYLMEEVLHDLGEEVHAFLLATSTLTRFCAPLCDAVTGKQNASAMIEYLEKHNLFIQPLDTEKRWYRYYQFFAGMMRLRNSNDLHDARAMHERCRRASAWCEQEGFLNEAIDYALQAQDMERAASLIEQFTYTNFMPGRVRATMAQIRSLPDEAFQSRARLSLMKAWGLFVEADLTGSSTYLTHAEAGAGAEDGALLGEIHAFRALVHVMQDDLLLALEDARLALALVPDEVSFLRAFAFFAYGLACEFTGRLDDAENAYRAANRISLAGDERIFSVLTGCQIGDVVFMRARALEAETSYLAILSYLEKSGRNLPIAGMLFISLGNLYYEWDELEKASVHYQQAIELGTSWDTLDILAAGYVGRMMVSLACDEVSAARRFAALAEQALEERILSTPTRIIVNHCIVRKCIRLGDHAELDRFLFEDTIIAALSPPWQEIAVMTQARIHTALGKTDMALEELARAQKSAESGGRITHCIQILALRTAALAYQGRLEKALESLRRALMLAAPGRFVRTFLDEGEIITVLLEKMMRGEHSRELSEHAAEVLATIRKTPPFVDAGKPDAEDGLIVSLSGREKEVLSLINAGCSNQEIADRLVLALSTVKTHINNIFLKLNVDSRTEALARGRSLNLL